MPSAHYDDLIRIGFTPEMAQFTVDADAKAQELREADPSLPFITAHVIASDLTSADRWHERIVSGEVEAERATHLVGSYARFQFALDHMPAEWVYENIADLWRGSDPNDTEVAYLKVWHEAKRHHRNRVITDGKRLPKDNPLTVYRGETTVNTPTGIAWTLDLEIAKKFARGAGIRVGNIKGYVLEAHVMRKDVLGYLTERGESEVVCDPNTLFGKRMKGLYE